MIDEKKLLSACLEEIKRIEQARTIYHPDLDKVYQGQNDILCRIIRAIKAKLPVDKYFSGTKYPEEKWNESIFE